MLEDFDSCLQLFIQNIQYSEDLPIHIKKLYDLTNKFVCEYCSVPIAHKSSYCRHLKKCKAKQHCLENRIEQLSRQIEVLQTVPVTTINDSRRNGHNINAQTVQNAESIHNGDNVQNNVQNNTNNYLCAFGQEDMSHITHEEMGKVIGMRYEGLMEFAKLLYKNKRNLNVFIPNVSRNAGMVFKPPNWELMREDAITDVVVQRGADMISDYMEAHTHLINGNDYYLMDKALTDIQKDKKENMKRKTDIKHIIEDNTHRKRVWDNYKEASDGDLIIPPVEFN